MTMTSRNAGFYGTDAESYYLTPSGRAYAFASGDFDGVREINAVPANATPLDGLMTPEECIEVCREIEAESGETLIEEAE
jgi:hypothetical protein